MFLGEVYHIFSIDLFPLYLGIAGFDSASRKRGIAKSIVIVLIFIVLLFMGTAVLLFTGQFKSIVIGIVKEVVGDVAEEIILIAVLFGFFDGCSFGIEEAISILVGGN